MSITYNNIGWQVLPCRGRRKQICLPYYTMPKHDYHGAPYSNIPVHKIYPTVPWHSILAFFCCPISDPRAQHSPLGEESYNDIIAKYLVGRRVNASRPGRNALTPVRLAVFYHVVTCFSMSYYEMGTR